MKRANAIGKNGESWTMKKAECWRIDAFELWCWRRLLRVPWTARRSNQSIHPECSLEGLMLKLKLQYFGHLMWSVDSLEKTLMLAGIGGRRRRGWQRWLDGITDSMDVSLSELRGLWWTGRPGVLQFMGSQRVGHDWETEMNWTELNWWKHLWDAHSELVHFMKIIACFKSLGYIIYMEASLKHTLRISAFYENYCMF